MQIAKNNTITFKKNKATITDYTNSRIRLNFILSKNDDINILIDEVLIEKKGKEYFCLDCFPQCKFLHLKRLFLEEIPFTLYFLNNNKHIIVFHKKIDDKIFIF